MSGKKLRQRFPTLVLLEWEGKRAFRDLILRADPDLEVVLLAGSALTAAYFFGEK
ncbi:hypothetical protein D3C81_2292290 [compost metagenome]